MQFYHRNLQLEGVIVAAKDPELILKHLEEVYGVFVILQDLHFLMSVTENACFC